MIFEFQGDSGGPLAIYRTNSCSGSQQGTWYLIGITSTGEYELNNGEKNGTKGYDHGKFRFCIVNINI